jgi:hypothetical protein
MNNIELAGAMISIVLLITSLKLNKLWLQIVCFGLITVFFALSQIKDSDSLSAVFSSTQILYSLVLCAVPVAAGLLSEKAIHHMRTQRVRSGK